MVWYAVPSVVFSVLCLYVGLYHLWIYLKRPSEKENLSFSVMTLLMVFYYIFVSQLYNADSPANSLIWMRLAFVVFPLYTSVFVFFTYHLTELEITKTPYIFTGINILFAVLLWTLNPEYTFTAEGAIPFEIEWLGIVYNDPRIGMVVNIFFVYLFINICFIFYIFISSYYAGKRYLVPAMVSVTIYFLTAISDMLVQSRVYSFMYLSEFGFIAIIINMAYTLLNKFIGLYNQVEDQTVQLEEKNRFQTELNSAFRKFVPHEFISFLNKESIVDLKLGDQVEKSMTVLFSDIRSFTTLSETLSAEENFNFLNSYLSRMGPVIRKNSGFIDKYIGDAIMALFPKNVDDAVRAAIEMRKTLRQYNQHRAGQNYEHIDIGIGIHTGTLMLGTIGESQRMEGTVISDAVNLAARLESTTKLMRAPVIISKECLDRLEDKDDYYTRFLGKIRVKGKTAIISLYEVFNGDPEDLIQEKLQNKDTFEKAITYIGQRRIDQAEILFKEIYNPEISDPVIKMHLEKIAKFTRSRAAATTVI
jgi:class 3 adenylate cyclase